MPSGREFKPTTATMFMPRDVPSPKRKGRARRPFDDA